MRRSQAPQIPYSILTGNNDPILDFDAYPLLTTNSPSPSFASQRNKPVVESDAEQVDADSNLEPGDADNSQSHRDSSWTAYNPFSSYGRQRMSRKVRSSGPAADRGIDDIEQSLAAESRGATGWRAGTRLCCFAVMICIVIESVLLIWAAVNNGGHANDGLVWKGSCDMVRKLEVWLLLPLNIVATILIGTSNYVMQVMSAPDREEINQAHRFASAIAVGGIKFTGSKFRDLLSGRPVYGRIRRTVWWVLVLSSLPIHLLLNLAFYGSVQAVDAGVVVVPEDFMDDLTWSQCTSNLTESSNSTKFACSMKHFIDTNQTRTLSASQCKSQYDRGFQTNASSVVVVTDIDTGPWYTLPRTVKVPSSYGLACQCTNKSCSTRVAVPEAERLYQITYNESKGDVTIGLGFQFCQNYTESGSTASMSLSEVSSSLLNLDDTISGALLLMENDTLSKISSIRALFNSRDYRYWATAQATGDYLSGASQAFLGGWDSRSWLCNASDLATGRECNTIQLRPDSVWAITPAAYVVRECYVLPKQEQCALRYSLKILVVTMCCDFAKLAAMIFALSSVSDPLTTLGDVIKSFLQEPDSYTKHVGLLDDTEASEWSFKSRGKVLEVQRQYCSRRRMFEMLKRHEESKQMREGRLPCDIGPPCLEPTESESSACRWVQNGGTWWTSVEPTGVPESWTSRQGRWFTIPSRTRWSCLGVLYWSVMAFVPAYFSFGMVSVLRKKLANTWTVGFGGPDPNAMLVGGLMDGTQSITWAAVVVNLPQMLFSSMYFIFNGTLTMMHTAHEWGSFTKKRKALRVSSPQGEQRSTYWLQLPWTYSLPLIVATGSLHWLLGRSVYLVKVDVFDYNDIRQTDQDFFACGFSLITVLALMILLGLMGVAISAISFTKLEPGIPLVRFNSLAIAAACHPDPSEKDLALKPLMWGVIDAETSIGVPHCSFSAKEVTPLLEGCSYK